MKISAREILDLLLKRHDGDVCVPECKNGPSQSSSHSRLDLWVMKRSWAHACAIGYEVKVARSDFNRDEKWRAYLAMCNLLSFVCPWGMIQPEELDDGVGLVWVTKTGGRLHTKRKAAFREADGLESVMRYALMSRALIDRSDRVSECAPTGVDRWRSWLVEREQGKEIGFEVSYRIASEMASLRRENKRLSEMMEGYDDVRRLLQEAGVGLHYAKPADALRRQVERANAALPPRFAESLRRLRAAADLTLVHLEAADDDT